jgi:hypothetical protein
MSRDPGAQAMIDQARKATDDRLDSLVDSFRSVQDARGEEFAYTGLFGWLLQDCTPADAADLLTMAVLRLAAATTRKEQ